MKKIRLGLLICLLGHVLAFAPPLLAEDTLYGIDRFGGFWQIDPDAGSPLGTSVRSSIFAGAVATFDSLVYSNGYFYAAFDYGTIVRFGFASGDEVIIGSTGKAIKDMVKDNSGQVYVTYGRKLARLNLSTLAITNEVDVGTNNFSSYYYPTGLASKDGWIVIAACSDSSGNDCSGTHYYSVNPATGGLGCCSCSGAPCSYDGAHNVQALATRPDNDCIVRDRVNYSENDNNFGGWTFLYQGPLVTASPDPGNCTQSSELGYLTSFFDDDPIMGLAYMTLGSGDCDPSDYRLLQNDTVTTQISRTSQGPIRAGYAVNPDETFGDYVVSNGGNLTLNSGMEVRLEPGFSVQGTGLLQVDVSGVYCS
jgi:hypothetical protein